LTTENAVESEVEESNVDADMEAGFNAAAGTEPVAEENTVEVVAETPVEAVADQPEEELVTLNQSEVKQLLARLEDLDKLKASQRDVYGRVGGIQDTLSKLKTAQANGGPVEISEDDLSELGDFGELKSAVGSVLRKALSKVGGGQVQADFTPLKQEFEQRLEQQEQRHQMQLLSVMHDDWRDVANSDKFRLWLNGQPEDYRARLNDSWDAIEISRALKSFKSQGEVNTAPVVQNRKARLESAVTPRGTPAVGKTAPTPDELMEQGFRQIRRA
jgi:hypothetical protein